MDINFTLVEVISDDEDTRDAVTAVIAKALKDKNFKDVTVVDNNYEPNKEPDEDSLLTYCKFNNPAIFNKTIKVKPVTPDN